MAGVVFCNPSSGKGDIRPADLRHGFSAHAVVECSPDDLAARVRSALAEGVDFVSVAGGDGSIRAVAQELMGTDTPLLPVPAGTRNHFARNMGIETLDDAVAAASHGSVRRIDVGTVNGKCFVNNSSIGMYPRVVMAREAHERALPHALANVVAMWEQVRHGHRFFVSVDGQRQRVWIVFVGNGRYGRGLLDGVSRDSLEDNLLDLLVVRADRPLARTRALAALLVGRLQRSRLLVRWSSADAELDVELAEVEVALDGEVERLSPPLRYESVPAALSVLVPSTD